jgi:hypothetical protein
MRATRTRAGWEGSDNVYAGQLPILLDGFEGMSENEEGFLKRWSRLKQEVKEPHPAKLAAPAHDPEAPPPELPPVEKLTMDSDFRGFFHPKVDENLRRAALKKLFSDPHFNVMDGLDVYIDDYSKPNPLPASMLAQLRQAQKILEWAADRKEVAGTETAALPPGPAPVIAEHTDGGQPSESTPPSAKRTDSG